MRLQISLMNIATPGERNMRIPITMMTTTSCPPMMWITPGTVRRSDADLLAGCLPAVITKINKMGLPV